MATQVSVQDHVTKFASGFSRQVNQQVVRAQREMQDKIRHEAAERGWRTRKQSEEKERQERWLVKRMPLARQGLARILVVGRSEPIQKIIDTLERLGNYEGITFYKVSRPSGGAWDDGNGSGTRDVMFEFRRQHLYLAYGGFATGQSTAWKLLYNADSPEEAAQEVDTNRNELLTADIEEFLNSIADPYPSNMSVIRNWDQRSYEWDPGDIAFQLLVSCARRSRFDNYLVQCLKELKVSF